MTWVERVDGAADALYVGRRCGNPLSHAIETDSALPSTGPSTAPTLAEFSQNSIGESFLDDVPRWGLVTPESSIDPIESFILTIVGRRAAMTAQRRVWDSMCRGSANKVRPIFPKRAVPASTAVPELDNQRKKQC